MLHLSRHELLSFLFLLLDSFWMDFQKFFNCFIDCYAGRVYPIQGKFQWKMFA